MEARRNFAPDQRIEHLVRQIVEIAHPLRILLFGSAARGQAQPDSDVDLLVIMPEGTHRRRVAQELYRQVSGGGQPFDVLVATPSMLEQYADHPGLLYHTILKEGREVYAAG